MSPENLNEWFPPDCQKHYMSLLTRRGGLTRRRAEYFVRLWGYLLVKQQAEESGTASLVGDLRPTDDFVPCSHREAADLFYYDQDKGSDRAAGMMIDRFATLGLLDKQFDGQTVCLKIRPIPELSLPANGDQSVPEPFTVEPDEFNPRTDAIPIANLIIRQYSEILQDTSIAEASHKTAKALRKWSQGYTAGLRVLRRQDNFHPIAVGIFYPVSSESEVNFFKPPSRSFFLTNAIGADPFTMSTSGDPDCSSIFIRAWVFDLDYMKGKYIHQFLEDAQHTLAKIQKDFPNVCDLYSMVIHPMHEELRIALGFQKTFQDNQRSAYWGYLALDHFLDLDIADVMIKLGMSKQRQQ